MGWWGFKKDGKTAIRGQKIDGYWGDSVADAVDNAIEHVFIDFLETIGRFPTVKELKYGIDFSLNPISDANEKYRAAIEISVLRKSKKTGQFKAVADAMRKAKKDGTLWG